MSLWRNSRRPEVNEADSSWFSTTEIEDTCRRRVSDLEETLELLLRFDPDLKRFLDPSYNVSVARMHNGLRTRAYVPPAEHRFDLEAMRALAAEQDHNAKIGDIATRFAGETVKA